MHLVLFGAWIAVVPLLATQRFDFGGGKPVDGYTKVAPSALYDAAVGYGFEPGETPPGYFSVRVPEEGNYKVTITLGDARGESVTTGSPAMCMGSCCGCIRLYLYHHRQGWRIARAARCI